MEHSSSGHRLFRACAFFLLATAALDAGATAPPPSPSPSPKPEHAITVPENVLSRGLLESAVLEGDTLPVYADTSVLQDVVLGRAAYAWHLQNLVALAIILQRDAGEGGGLTPDDQVSVSLDIDIPSFSTQYPINCRADLEVYGASVDLSTSCETTNGDGVGRHNVLTLSADGTNIAVIDVDSKSFVMLYPGDIAALTEATNNIDDAVERMDAILKDSLKPSSRATTLSQLHASAP